MNRRRGKAKTVVDAAPSAREEWLDEQIAVLRELVEGEEQQRSGSPPHPPEPSAPRRGRTRPDRAIIGRTVRAVASAFVTAWSFLARVLLLPLRLARLLLLPFRLLSVVRGALRPDPYEIVCVVAAVALSVAVGAGIAILLG